MNQKTHIHVDTLYLGRKLDTVEYYDVMEYIADNNSSFFGDSKGLSWYQLDAVRVGLAIDPEAFDRANRFHLIVQFEHQDLFKIDWEKLPSRLKLPLFFGDYKGWYILRMDFNITFRDFGSPLEKLFKSKYFKVSSLIRKGNEIETIYLGKRSSGKVFRFYNKTRELQQNKQTAKAEYIKKYFGTLDNLYTIEIEMRRDYIRDRIMNNNGTLADWYHLLEHAIYLLKSVVAAPDTDANRSKIKNNHYDRIEWKPLFVYDHLFKNSIMFNPVEPWKPTNTFLAKRFKKMIENAQKHGLDFDLNKVLEIIS